MTDPSVISPHLGPEPDPDPAAMHARSDRRPQKGDPEVSYVKETRSGEIDGTVRVTRITRTRRKTKPKPRKARVLSQTPEAIRARARRVRPALPSIEYINPDLLSVGDRVRIKHEKGNQHGPITRIDPGNLLEVVTVNVKGRLIRYNSNQVEKI